MSLTVNNLYQVIDENRYQNLEFSSLFRLKAIDFDTRNEYLLGDFSKFFMFLKMSKKLS